MKRFRKILIWFFVILAAIIVLAFVGASYYINNSKPLIEKAVTKNIGLETRIDGPISLKVLPGLSFVVNEMKVISNETYVFRVNQVEIAIDYTKLFNAEVVVNALHFIQPQVYIIRDTSGIFNFEQLYAQIGKPVLNDPEKYRVDLEELTINDGRILYFDRGLGDTLQANGIHLLSGDVGLTGTATNIDVKKLRFNGKLAIDHFKLNNLVMDSLTFTVNGKGGRMSISEKKNKFLGAQVAGKALVDFNQKPASIHIEQQVKGLASERFLFAIGSDEYLSGTIDYSLDLNFHSFDWEKSISSANGTFNLNGSNLTFYGVNIDELLKDFQVSNEFNIIDLGAVFLTGPYGSVFTKGINFKDFLADYDGEKTQISSLVSNWTIDNGVASAQDVAFSTEKYRLAMSGKLDLLNKEYNNVSIVMVNHEGCAALSQNITGKFRNPETESIAVMGLVFGPVDNVWKILATPSGKKCDPVYSGSVQHPK